MTLHNQKGIVLITAYVVVLMLIGLSVAFFMRTINERRLSQIQNDSLKAFYNAEKAVSYAYFESADKGWTWFTHDWKDTEGRAVSLGQDNAYGIRTNSLKTANPDCHFITEGNDQGCYAANDGSFILKTFSDPEASGVTVVRAKGISGNVERVIEFRISRECIFDYAFWTPYDLQLNIVGNNVNGGRIHSNGNIYMTNAKRLSGVDMISTGKDKSMYYACHNTYYAPGYYDWYVDGSGKIDGEVPVPHLGKPDISSYQGIVRRWAGTTDEDPMDTQAPWLYKTSLGDWRWKNSYGEYMAGSNYWPPRDWKTEEFYFYGDSRAVNNQIVGGKTFNYYNTWIYPAKKNAKGEIEFDATGAVMLDSPEQIPAELEGAMWDWNKYYGFDSKFGGSSQKPLKFSVYDPATAGKKPVEDTRWKIVTNPDSTKSVVMTDLDDPQGDTYWNMLQRPDYWKSIGYGEDWATLINPEVLDGTYGSEIALGQRTIQVDNTNSMKQPEAWNNLLKEKGLDDVLLANERGEDMEAPRFSTTYKQKAQKAGLYLSKSGGTHTLNYGKATAVTYTANTCGKYDPNDPDAYNTWLNCLEKSIDVLVDRLNTAPNGTPLLKTKKCANKKKFINTYTNKWNVVLELDLGKMQNAGTFPANGIIYSEVPIRLTNGGQLPYATSTTKSSFNVISEENVYLKGNFNNQAQWKWDPLTRRWIKEEGWMPAAVISKKQIYTLSSNFNDPQVSPAFVNYPNYPYVYATKDANGNFIEADPKVGGGSWVYYGNYLSGSSPYSQLVNLRNVINNAWRATFEQNDPTGSKLYTVSSGHPNIDGQEWGAMPNRVSNNHTYNCLMASYYYGNQGWTTIGGQSVPKGSLPYGVNLERWEYRYTYKYRGQTYTYTYPRYKYLNGTYFQLDWADEDDPDRFTAHQSDGPVDYYYYVGFDSRPTSRVAGSPYSGPYWLEAGPNTTISYDARFRNPKYSQSKPLFFGEGGATSWREIPVASF